MTFVLSDIKVVENFVVGKFTGDIHSHTRQYPSVQFDILLWALGAEPHPEQ
jgi:hypothetical protein